MLEFIHALVETLDKYFENVCELDIMFNLEKAHFILGERFSFWRLWYSMQFGQAADEMVTNGCIVETNKANVLKPILLLEKVSKT
jgi:AP-4 complex subunit sigma-1